MEQQDQYTPDTLSVGAQLAQARQAMQLSIADIAQQLKLSPQQIERLEHDDFAALGAVFSRGFIRQYARLVDLNADELVAAMAGNLQRSKESLSVYSEDIPLGKSLSKYWLILIVTAVILVIGIPLAIYYWLSSDTTTTVAIKKSVTAHQLVKSPPIKTPIPTVAPIQPPAVEQQTSTERDSHSDAIDPASNNTGRLSFKFDSDSWVEIRDGSNHTVLSHLYRAGETAEISGTPPLSLVIGNAAKVSLQYNDQPVDLTPHTGVTVARVTLK
jgi:cytoskeleton protein RodZ